ncbi:4-alpha-glucanotransferase [Aliiglaciecola sp. CAU 1673]|uniref:4-alpha-glucanotransferase n=1 Tax=Aliiglaciecola sp. CAU 1673 TaxID=3032595 RepID=UPI0023DC5B3F|nr:4-alpha-glucanotransferase [Aliiglaciecola sp. CAU 1673]MDF2178761.1 4-alpha-glucanotransferase [Aliiglaciecola sp. CAU 1673]
MNDSMIEKLVELRGIESNFIDAWGKPAQVEPASKAKLLKAMGYPVEDEQALHQKLDEDAAKAWLNPLDPVQVNRIGEPLLIALRLPIELVNDSYDIELTTEEGEVITQGIEPSSGELINVAHIQDGEFQEYILALSAEPPIGYHQVSLKAGDGEELSTMRLIIAPKACYKPDNIAKGEKMWGLSVQLYCLRSERNWGIGDFSDLSYLIRESAKQGAQFVGLNPIHALYPSNPDACSPYSPSSRRWLNTIYLDVTAIEGFESKDIQALVTSESFKQRLAEARAKDHVDYATVSSLKLEALRLVFEHYNQQYLKHNSKQNRAFKAFVKEGGESLEMLATYEALQEMLKAEGKDFWGWPVFPAEYAEYHLDAVKKFKKSHADNIKFYLFLQWQAAQQLALADKQADDNGMSIGIYRDLAVGVSEGSAEIWGNRELYATDASVGAPPDILGPLGQNWGLPPMDPLVLYRQRYQPIIDLFSSNMQSCGALRIDHVMALLRLWWVYKGDNAKQGGYVYYPVDDLLGILALESHRHQALVIGEDLGTVPEEIREKLADNGVHSYRVFFFEQAKDGGFFSPAHYPEQSMATLTTHDMPTLTGFWHCLDLELGKSLNLYPSDEVLAELYRTRHENKQQLLDTLHGHGSIPQWIGRYVDEVGMSRELNHGMQVHMAKGSSALLSLQLEDWLEMDKPVNIPGTSSEYPNWRRKLNRSLEETFSDPVIQDLSKRLTEARKQASAQ